MRSLLPKYLTIVSEERAAKNVAQFALRLDVRPHEITLARWSAVSPRPPEAWQRQIKRALATYGRVDDSQC